MNIYECILIVTASICAAWITVSYIKQNNKND